MNTANKIRDRIKKISCLHKDCKEDIIEEYGVCRIETHCKECNKLVSKEIICNKCSGFGNVDHADKLDGFTEYTCSKCGGKGKIDYDKEMTPDMPPLKC